MFILPQQEVHKKNKEHAVHKMEQHLMGMSWWKQSKEVRVHKLYASQTSRENHFSTGKAVWSVYLQKEKIVMAMQKSEMHERENRS